MKIIPLIPIQDQQLAIILDNQNCTIRVYQRKEFMYFDLYLDEIPIVQGARCVYGMWQLQYTNAFKGNFIWVNSSYEDPNYMKFSESNFLAFITQDEIDNATIN